MSVQSKASNNLRTVTGALIINGILTYAYFTLPTRASLLDKEEFAIFATLWFVVFTVGAGLFVPLEQEIVRAVVTSAEAEQGRIFSTLAALGLVVAAVLSGMSIVFRDGLADLFFAGETSTVDAFAFALVGFMAFQCLRGWAAANLSFGKYSMMILVDSTSRLGLLLVLFSTETARLTTMAFTLGAGMMIASIAGGFSLQIKLAKPDPSQLRSLAGRFAGLSSSQFLAQIVLNGPLLIAPLVGGAENATQVADLGVGLLLLRTPLLLYPAVAATVLPRLVASLENQTVNVFRRELFLWTAGGLTATLLGSVVSAIVGGQVLQFLFGPEYSLPIIALMCLFAGSMLFILASTLSLGLLALQHRAFIIVGWAGSTAAGTAVLLIPASFLSRISLAYLISTSTAVLIMGLSVAIFSGKHAASPSGHPPSAILS